ncbi:DotD/TraH family lipoprotein [Brucella sp. NBRC 12950]|uniref:DotD/TraH family lipoprotein n=1 Tax=Brucella sp. NBRC 12950 TaxID=2994518 RepID=UPI0024A05DED|nr:DotD/TraH family lipoprotein [Brucella sp. NBRC 12950]GLU29905.1 hypothetical protein Brsp01_51380 [Brucella sp. NBRC 12950]
MRYILIAGIVLMTGCTNKPVMDTKPISPIIDQKIDTIKEEKNFVYLEKSDFNHRPTGVIRMIESAQSDTSLFMPMRASFQGPIEDLIRNTAAEIGYGVRKYGERPGAPVLVSVKRSSDTAYAILEEGLLQSQGLVRLTIDPAHKSMTVRYKRPEKSPVPHIDDARL